MRRTYIARTREGGTWREKTWIVSADNINDVFDRLFDMECVVVMAFKDEMGMEFSYSPSIETNMFNVQILDITQFPTFDVEDIAVKMIQNNDCA